jgi:hypothetical protein
MFGEGNRLVFPVHDDLKRVFAFGTSQEEGLIPLEQLHLGLGKRLVAESNTWKIIAFIENVWRPVLVFVIDFFWYDTYARKSDIFVASYIHLRRAGDTPYRVVAISSLQVLGKVVR